MLMIHRKRLVAVLSATALLSALVMLAAPDAGAHAVLISTEPASGATLDSPPDRIVLHFDEAIEPDFGQLQVTGPDGQRLDEAPPSAEGPVVETPIASGTRAGEHTVVYRVVSADGHPIEGTFTYELTEAGADGGAPDDPAPADAPTPGPADEPGVAEPTAPTAPTEEADRTEATAAADEDGADGDRPVPVIVLALVAVVLLGGMGVVLARRGEDDPPPASA